MTSWIKNNKRNLLFTMSVFVFFFVIDYLTPLAGDDWGYAINGMKENPFVMAYNFYFSWSGRYFSELWGFIVAPNKWLWNILNPLLFATIYFCINKIANKKNNIIEYLLLLFIMLFVSDNLRMETYSWIMGSTYVVPLTLSLLYFLIVLKDDNTRPLKIVCAIVLNFYIGLTMENIAGVMILANLLFLIDDWLNGKRNIKFFSVVLLSSFVSFVLLRISPGAAYRLSENVVWNNMTLFEQIGSNIIPFIKYTFYDNKYLILLTGLTILFKIIIDKKNNFEIFGFIILFISSSILLLSRKIFTITNIVLFESLSLYETNGYILCLNILVWIIYVVYLFYFIYTHFEEPKKRKLFFFLLISGASNIVMMISPIFGSRSSLYFYYYMAILVIMIIDSFIDINYKCQIIIILLIVSVLGFRSYKILNKYLMVHQVQQDREEKIAYYLDNPEDKDVWLPRMPIYSIHSADIEKEDTYHMEVFKKYYGLADDCVINFYVED